MSFSVISRNLAPHLDNQDSTKVLRKNRIKDDTSRLKPYERMVIGLKVRLGEDDMPKLIIARLVARDYYNF